MYWEDTESFTAWRSSDAFAAAHNRPEPDSEDAKKESPIIGSEIITYEIASVKEASK
ncbi:Heme oxygenase (staphylobilin-producing) 1 [compost metagenome]